MYDDWHDWLDKQPEILALAIYVLTCFLVAPVALVYGVGLLIMAGYDLAIDAHDKRVIRSIKRDMKRTARRMEVVRRDQP